MTKDFNEKNWWQRLLELLFRREQTPQSQPPASRKQPQNGGQNGQDKDQRYSVQSGKPGSNQIAGADTLAEAHKLWQQLTNQQGSIIDNLTGENVTPEPDDNGRYVVLDQADGQQGSYDDLGLAKQAWESLTGGEGRIVDTQTGQEVTPQTKAYLSDAQLKAALGLAKAGRGALKQFINSDGLTIDMDAVQRMIPQISRMPLPVFDVTNIAGKGKPQPTRTVPIKRRKVTVETVKKPVEVESTGKPQPTGRIPVVQPTDDVDVERITGVRDLPRVSARQLAIPSAILGRRVAGRELYRQQFFEPVLGEAPIQKRRVWQEFEEPKVEEWTENVEVSEEPQSQLLEIVVDISGSMNGAGINLAIALICVILAKHMDDGSKYLLRAFAYFVGNLRRATSEDDKHGLVKYAMGSMLKENLGTGTSILSAVTSAAEDVRATATGDDRPEVLLITDGDDYLTATDVFGAVGNDVILHTVLTAGIQTNESLKQHSSTYYELTDAFGSVRRGSLSRSSYLDI